MKIKTSHFFKAIVVAVIAYFIRYTTVWRHYELQWIIPYALLFTAPREVTLKAWQKYVKIDTRIVYPASPIPEIAAEGNI
jgi:hypothetical protein